MTEDNENGSAQEQEAKRMQTFANFCAFVDKINDWPLEGMFDKEMFKNEYRAMGSKFPKQSPAELVTTVFDNLEELLINAHFDKQVDKDQFNRYNPALKKLYPLFAGAVKNSFEHNLNDMQLMHVRNFGKFLDTINDKYFGVGTSEKEEIAEFFKNEWITNPSLSLSELVKKVIERIKQDKTRFEPQKLIDLLEQGLVINFRVLRPKS